MGIKLKITLAFSLVFIVLSCLFGLIGYQQVRDMMIRVAGSHAWRWRRISGRCGACSS